jgi:hypothetical protein
MQSARQPNVDRSTAARSPNGSATNRTLVWFSDDAVQRRRRAMPAGEASRPIVWGRPQLFACVGLATLAAMIGLPSFNADMRPCWTEPAVLASGAEVAAKMTVAHNAACALSTKLQSITAHDVRIEVPPQHGTLALRGRSGVTYRPESKFTGNDFFAYTLRSRSARDNMSFVRVSVTVK